MNTAWSCAKLLWFDVPLFDATAASALPLLSDFKPRELANLSWSCATLSCTHKPLMSSIASASLNNITAFNAPDLASTAWAFETLPLSHHPLMQAISAESVRKSNDFNSQDISNTSWAFATLMFRDMPLLDSLSSQSIPIITDFRQQELSTTAWAFATLRVEHVPLLDAIASSSIRTSFDHHSLAGTAWSFSTLRYNHNPLMQAISSAALSKISELNPQDLSNTAWSFAHLGVQDAPLLAAIASASRPLIHQFRTREVDMTLWALSRLESLQPMLELLELVDDDRIGSLGLATALMSCDMRGFVREQVHLLRRVAQSGYGAPAANVAASRLAATGDVSAALQCLQDMGAAGHTDVVSLRIAAACGIPNFRPFNGVEEIPAAPPGRSKARMLLTHVLQNAPPGDPEATCAAIVGFAEDVLHPSRQWLKIAGGAKAELLIKEFRSSPAGGDILEIGTYLGYSSIRLASALPDRRIITVEVDAEHALVAQCVIAHAGLAHRIYVHCGHSKDVLEQLPDWYSRSRDGAGLWIAGVFMDQCGSRFWEDLSTVVSLGCLAPGAVIAADNCLKPGTPLFLWHILFGEAFEGEVVSLEEFGMPGVEDWITVARFRPGATGVELSTVEPPRAIHDLEWEAYCTRLRASGAGSVPFEEWAALAAGMRKRLAALGIGPI